MEIIRWLKNHWVWKPHNPIYNGNGSIVFYIRAPHHLYLGIALIITGWLCAPYYSITASYCYVAGFLIALDDIIEHTLIGRTPLRLFFDFLHKKGWSYLR